MSVYRIVSQLHENNRLIELGQTGAGRLAIWAIATLLLLDDPKVMLLISPILALLQILRDKRRVILAIGALAAYFGLAMDRGLTEPLPLLFGMATTIGLSWLYFRLALRFDRLPSVMQRFPLLFAHLPVLMLVAVGFYYRANFGPLKIDPLHAGVLSLVTFMMWRWSYLLWSGRRGTVQGTGFLDHLFYLLPAFGGSNTPFGKGHDTLSKHAPDTPLDWSRAQLAGIKVLVLLHLWRWVLTFFNKVLDAPGGGVLQELLGGPGLHRLRLGWHLATETPGDVTLLTAWIILLMSLFMQVLWITIFGHLIVGCLRLFGFNVFRNTYKPLLSQSLVEYWNRYYYYFKELLVEFFFYPTFLACSRFAPRLRMFLAIMAAACLGNFYYHVIRDFNVYLSVAGDELMALLSSRAIYSVCLGIGIFVSMIREYRRRRSLSAQPNSLAGIFHQGRRILGVWLFFALLQVWVAGSDTIPLGQRVDFLLTLFAIG